MPDEQRPAEPSTTIGLVAALGTKALGLPANTLLSLCSFIALLAIGYGMRESVPAIYSEMKSMHLTTVEANDKKLQAQEERHAAERKAQWERVNKDSERQILAVEKQTAELRSLTTKLDKVLTTKGLHP